MEKKPLFSKTVSIAIANVAASIEVPTVLLENLGKTKAVLQKKLDSGSVGAGFSFKYAHKSHNDPHGFMLIASSELLAHLSKTAQKGDVFGEHKVSEKAINAGLQFLTQLWEGVAKDVATQLEAEDKVIDS